MGPGWAINCRLDFAKIAMGRAGSVLTEDGPGQKTGPCRPLLPIHLKQTVIFQYFESFKYYFLYSLLNGSVEYPDQCYNVV